MLPLLVGGMVSGSISLPSRGSFRLSLTVLVHYRWQRVFSLRRWFSQIPAEFLVLRGTWVSSQEVYSLSPKGLSPSMAAFSKSIRLEIHFVTRRGHYRFLKTVPRHPLRNAGRLYSRNRFRLTRFRSPLLTGSLLFSLPSGT